MFKPMLAQPFQMKYLKKDYALQYKYNGVRCVFKDGRFWTRTGKPILAVPSLLEELKATNTNIVLDGELYCHGKSLQEIVSSVRKTVKIKEDLDIQYFVFDCYMSDAILKDKPFRYRWTYLNRWFNLLNFNRVQLAYTELKTGLPQSDIELDIGSPIGYEGTIARNLDGPYKPGKRSYDVLKIKPSFDDEFLVIGVTQLMAYDKIKVPIGTFGAKHYADGTAYKNSNPRSINAMGSLVCQTKAGQQFEVGTGFSDELRDLYWSNPPIGSMVTIKYSSLTDDGIPFHPVFVAIRDYD